MSLRETVGFFCHIKGYHVAPHLVGRHIDQSAMRLVGAPRVLHDIIRFPGFIVGQSDDGHCMSPTFPADGMTMLQGAVSVRFERVEWYVQQAVVLPVVGHGHLYLFVIRRVWPAGQRQVFLGGTHAMCELQGGVARPQHKDPLGASSGSALFVP